MMKGFGISTTTSGDGMVHPLGHFGFAGAPVGMPSSEPESTQDWIVLISADARDALFANSRELDSSNHGGILRVVTASRIPAAHGRTCRYVRSGMGPISPGRWQLWHRFCSIGSTSL